MAAGASFNIMFISDVNLTKKHSLAGAVTHFITVVKLNLVFNFFRSLMYSQNVNQCV